LLSGKTNLCYKTGIVLNNNQALDLVWDVFD
jgi:hypothetical protein